MLDRRRLLPAIVRDLVSLPDRAAHGLLVREVETWVRLEFLGLVAHCGIVDALGRPSTAEEIAADAGITDIELLEAVLSLGVALRELRRDGGRYRVSGRRLRAIAGRSADLRGLVEELVVYDSPIYVALSSHLRGAPAQPYDAEHGRVIADASRIAEPVLGPAVRAVAADRQPTSVLDVGCGTGVYLRHALEAVPGATGTGIDAAADALDAARSALADLQASGRCELRHGDVGVVGGDLGRFDLVLLLNNIYYWAPDDRPSVLRALRDRLSPGGTLVVASATPDARTAFNRHLDVMLRVTASSHRLPTAGELADDLRTSGFEGVAVIEPVPGSGLAVATGTSAGYAG